MLTEQWRPIEGRDGYLISSLGRVKSFRQIPEGKILKSSGNVVRGYPVATFTEPGGKRRYRYLHHLVLEAFVGPRPEGHEACHNDGNKLNNSAANLRWDTRAANLADKLKHGTHGAGERNARSKLTQEQVAMIRQRAADGPYGTQARLARELGVTSGAIAMIVNGKRWKEAVSC